MSKARDLQREAVAEDSEKIGYHAFLQARREGLLREWETCNIICGKVFDLKIELHLEDNKIIFDDGVYIYLFYFDSQNKLNLVPSSGNGWFLRKYTKALQKWADENDIYQIWLEKHARFAQHKMIQLAIEIEKEEESLNKKRTRLGRDYCNYLKGIKGLDALA